MKKYFVIAAFLFVSTSIFAQDWTAQTVKKDGKSSYDSYLTNDWSDNLFIGIGGGISTRFTAGQKSDIIKSFVNPAVNIYLMKWFTPRIGARLGYQGFNGREGLAGYNPYQINHSPLPYQAEGSEGYWVGSETPGTLYYGSFHLYGDLMWNLMNTFSTFRRDRFYTLSLYASGGYQRLYDNKTEAKGIGSQNCDNEFILGAGIFNTFRITDRLIATADLRYSNHASRYRTTSGVRTNVASLTIGLAYNLCRTYWTDVKEVKATVDEAKEAQMVAEKAVKETQAKNTKLENKVDNLEKELQGYKDEEAKFIKVDPVEYADLRERAANADLVVYFYINQSTLTFSELYRIRNFASTVLAKDPDHVFKITGSSDKGTGTEAFNATLSMNRALALKQVLIKEFGVKESNIQISTVITDKHVDGALDRCAMIER